MHLDMMEACDMIKPSFLLNVIMDSKGNITEAVAGNYAKAFERGCELLQENNGLKLKIEGYSDCFCWRISKGH